MANMAEMGAAKLGSKNPKKEKPKLHMRIRPTDNGAYHIEHEMQGEPMGPEGNKNYAYADLNGVHDHIDEHYGKKKAKKSKKDQKKEAKEEAAEAKEEASEGEESEESEQE